MTQRMTVVGISVVVFILALTNGNPAATKQEPQINSEDCGISGSQRIFGGNATKMAEYPWMALLKYRLPDGFIYACGGTLINDRYVLTAAHCIVDSLVGVRLGEHDLRTDPDCEPPPSFGKQKCAPKPQDFDIENGIKHEDYSTMTFKNDIALIRLNRAVDLRTAYVQTICLPDGANLQKNLAGKNLTVTGWGTTEHSDGQLINGTTGSTLLMQVNVVATSTSQCSKVTPFAKYKISDDQLCAGGSVTNQDSCSGDSGGPLQMLSVVGDESKYVQFGVVSFGIQMCGTPGVPGVYTRVSKYMTWIRQNIKP